MGLENDFKQYTFIDSATSLVAASYTGIILRAYDSNPESIYLAIGCCIGLPAAIVGYRALTFSSLKAKIEKRITEERNFTLEKHISNQYTIDQRATDLQRLNIRESNIRNTTQAKFLEDVLNEVGTGVLFGLSLAYLLIKY